MAKKEFKSLSEKIEYYHIHITNIKEFIKREDKLLNQLWEKEISWNEFFTKRKKLAGSKLITK